MRIVGFLLAFIAIRIIIALSSARKRVFHFKGFLHMPKPISKAGLQAIMGKLKEMRSEFETLPAIIAEAREKGDLKENAEYHSARERQSMLQAQLAKLENDIADSQIIDPAELPADIVNFGKTVTLLDETSKQSVTYTIVGELESDIALNKIAISTPVARGLLGKKKGEKAVIRVPAGEKTYEIVSITL